MFVIICWIVDGMMILIIVCYLVVFNFKFVFFIFVGIDVIVFLYMCVKFGKFKIVIISVLLISV